MFADHPVRKQAFLHQKNYGFYNFIEIFPKGKTHKMNFEILFDDHPVRKQALLKYKNVEFTELPN